MASGLGSGWLGSTPRFQESRASGLGQASVMAFEHIFWDFSISLYPAPPPTMRLHDLREGMASDVFMGSGAQGAASRKLSPGKFHKDLIVWLFPEATAIKRPSGDNWPNTACPIPTAESTGAWFDIHLHGNTPSVST